MASDHVEAEQARVNDSQETSRKARLVGHATGRHTTQRLADLNCSEDSAKQLDKEWVKEALFRLKENKPVTTD